MSITGHPEAAAALITSQRMELNTQIERVRQLAHSAASERATMESEMSVLSAMGSRALEAALLAISAQATESAARTDAAATALTQAINDFAAKTDDGGKKMAALTTSMKRATWFVAACTAIQIAIAIYVASKSPALPDVLNIVLPPVQFATGR